MARVAATITVPSTSGVVVTPATFTVDGISIANNGRRALRVTNGSVASVDITEQFGASALIDGVAPPDRVVAVAASATKWFGPYGSEYNQDDGTVWVDVSAFASVTYEVVEISPR